MKITIENTNLLVEMINPGNTESVPARVWTGVTEGGIEVQLLVTRIGVAAREDLSQFESELRETPAPMEVVPSIFPLRMIL